MDTAAAYSLLVLGGKAAPTAADIKAVIVAAGKEEPDEASIENLLKDMEGKELAAVIDAGMEKLKDVQIGGGGGGGGGPGRRGTFRRDCSYCRKAGLWHGSPRRASQSDPRGGRADSVPLDGPEGGPSAHVEERVSNR